MLRYVYQRRNASIGNAYHFMQNLSIVVKLDYIYSFNVRLHWMYNSIKKIDSIIPYGLIEFILIELKLFHEMEQT